MDVEDAENTSKLMNIKELCEIAGVSRSTVYHYLKSGLLHSPIKEGPTKLRYDQRHNERLQEIRHFREKKKLSLGEIKKIFQVTTSPENILEKNTDEVKNLILDKAIELVSKKGFAKTKISDIAEELNMGKGTFYLYFKNKEELFLKCIERFSDIFLPKVLWEDIRKEKHFFKRSSKRMFYMLQSFHMFMGIIGIVKLAIRGTDAEISKAAMDCFQIITQPLTKELQRNIEAGIVREIDASFISFLLVGVGEAAGYWRMIHPEYSIEETTGKILDFMAKGLASTAVDSQHAEKEDSPKFTVVDQNDNALHLQDIRINGSSLVSGSIGGGCLEVPLERIEVLEKAPAKHENTVLIRMDSEEQIQIQVDGTAVLTGQSSFGKYTISLADINAITKLPIY
ncbi:hypothetical protein DSCO28_17380 [Desulfosarcina ovata subsp. sediminis]|uniref:HTH tetR-type domain-containing protein n=1 Tax=Desulfosarcina ovata subsp. sediminis TaxID=885957 RepID=A0A5K7ZGF6_9BACT|nr:TetR family transcriptional regulator [Desulfosarcina ovata]BBO81172.1 hypothetical protein DSCO28_17380 [Desulfosarcina ovata subsp. sediminis]